MSHAPTRPAGLKPLRVLIIEDAEDDLQLLLLALRRAGYAPDHACVHSAAGLAQALERQRWDIVLSDYTLPDFSGLQALAQVQAHDPDLPFILISGNIGEEVAVAAMRAGAHDYLIKGNLTRLGAAIDRELREAVVRQERRRADRELREAKQRLQALSNRMLEIQENERRHLARELHDEIGQALTAVKLNLQALERRVDEGAARRLTREVTGLVGAVLDQVRALSLDLRPPQLDDLGLVPALHWLVQRSAGTAPPAVLLHADPQPRRLPASVETAGYRLAQEALTNAMRHARASRVDIQVEDHGDCLKLSVRDDGRGFDLPAALARAASGQSMGLLGMRERVSLAGGQLDISTRPGGGTEVCAVFPLAGPARDAAGEVRS